MRRLPRENGNRPRYIPANAGLSTDDWIYWEMERWILHNETPGRFGTYGVGDEA